MLRKGLISRLLLLASRDATLRGSSTTSRILPNVIQERKGQWSHWQHLCSWKAFFSILSYMMWNLLKLIEFSEDLAWKLFAETKFNFYSTTFVTFFHGVWKSEKKVAFNIASEVKFTFWVDKSLLKMPKMVHFGEFFENWSLQSNSATRQVTFIRTKIVPKLKNSNAIF